MWCFGFGAEFFLPYFNKLIFLVPFLKKNYSLLCHQDPQKVIAAGSYETLVCARCAGIYLGALISSFANLFILKDFLISKKILFLSSIPMILDAVFTTFQIYNYSKIIAFLTGFLFGITSFLYFYNALLDLILELREKKN